MSNKKSKVVRIGRQSTLTSIDWKLLESIAGLSIRLAQYVDAIILRGFLTAEERRALDLFLEFRSIDRRGKSRSDRHPERKILSFRQKSA
jgi:hypothetical protein